jgi:subtilisin family serine protease
MLSFQSARKDSRVRLTLLFALSIGFLLCLSFALPPASHASRGASTTSAVSSAKRRRAEFVPGHVLVRYKSEKAATLQAAMKTLSIEGRDVPIQIERFEGSDLVDGLRLAHVAESDTLSAIATLKQQSDVLYAEPDYIMHADLTPNDTLFPNSGMYGLTKIGAPTAWNTTTGSSSVVIGFVDEGIDITHQDLQANIWTNPAPGSISGISGDLHGYDFVNNSGTWTPGDHATHVAGTAGAVGNNGIGVVGVNWTVGLMTLRFLGPGGGFDSDAIRAISYAKQMRDLWVSSGGTKGANIRVLSNSYGGGSFSQSFLDAINAVNQSGILFVAAAGNDSANTDTAPHYPSSYKADNVISVAATDSSDSRAFFSNFGPQSVTLGAPGVNVLSTETNNTYVVESGTSMSTPHVSGSAALLLAKNPNLTVQQLKALLSFNGDPLSSLNGSTLTGRRLNVANSLAALALNDTTPPGTVGNFHVNTQSGRSFNLGWTTSGDDGPTGQASLYQLSFTDAATGAVVPLSSVVPPSSGTAQTMDVKVPIGHTNGTISLREFDKVGNEGTPAKVNVSISFADGNPYAKTLGANAPLTTGGTHLGLTFDDRYLSNYSLPFSFPFFGQNYNVVTISTNGNLYFTPPSPPLRPGGDADDVPSSTGVLANFKMIAGMWDDLYLGTDQRPDADVYVVQPDASRIIFRWQGVPCNDFGSGCTFGGPINFEVELRSNGIIQTRYGAGNTNLFPVVGISGGEPDPYVMTDLTSESTPTSLTNAPTVTYIPRTVINPLEIADFFVSQQYRDFLSREADLGGLTYWSGQITNCGSDPSCLSAKRVDVSNAFFFEPEYQQTGSFVYRVYREAFGNQQPFPNTDSSNPTEANKLPAYAKFAPDRALVVGGSSLAQSQLDFATAFAQRTEFTNKYPANLTLDQFVDAVLLTIKNDIGVDLTSQRGALIALGSRGAVLYRLADDNASTNPINNRAFIDAEYNRAFVFGEYGGYLRRDSDIGGFLFWLGQVNKYPLRFGDAQHAMVCSFETSTEYQLRFSPLHPHSNNECPR